MRFIISIITTSLVCYGGYWFWQSNPDFRHFISEFVSKQVRQKELQTLEMCYHADQIMREAKLDSIKERKRHYGEPELRFYPYVLLDVKFSKNQERTEESSMLWSLVDGELVINTKKWETTHGYEDCINARVTKAEFMLLNALAVKEGQGLVEKRQLLHLTGGDFRAIESMVSSCKKKKLLVEYTGGLRLHFEGPKFVKHPTTNFDQPVVTKSYRNAATTIASKYTISQIKSLAESAFGKEFSIRSAREVFIPIYTIRLKNPDGSIQTTHWNAVNGVQVYMKDGSLEITTSNPLQDLISG